MRLIFIYGWRQWLFIILYLCVCALFSGDTRTTRTTKLRLYTRFTIWNDGPREIKHKCMYKKCTCIFYNSTFMRLVLTLYIRSSEYCISRDKYTIQLYGATINVACFCLFLRQILACLKYFVICGNNIN